MLEFGELNRTYKFSVPQLTKELRDFVGTDDIKLFTKRDANVDKNQIVISGLYDPFEDQANFSSISIFVNYSKQKNIVIQNLDWLGICISLIECVGHESIHQEQYRARDFDRGPNIFVSAKEDTKLRNDQEYLGDPDEIEAYGFSIAAEVFLKDNPERISGKHVVKTVLYKAYCEAFGPNHIVTRHLLENVLKYYNRLTITGGVYVEG